jgi:hypothetical protein
MKLIEFSVDPHTDKFVEENKFYGEEEEFTTSHLTKFSK